MNPTEIQPQLFGATVKVYRAIEAGGDKTQEELRRLIPPRDGIKPIPNENARRRRYYQHQRFNEIIEEIP